MADLISRHAAIDALDNIKIPRNASWYPYYQQALTVMSRLPAAQPERKVGEWMQVTYNDKPRFECSSCGCLEEVPTFRFGGVPMWGYCPNCGAKMEG